MPIIKGISTLEGGYCFSHEKLAEWMPDSGFAERYLQLSREGSIESKRTFIPNFQDWMEGKNPTSHRMRMFSELSEDIGKQVALKSLEKVGWKPSEVTHLITISCTGIEAPGLECRLTESLVLRPNIQRFAVNFMGCYAAFHGLRLGHLLLKENPSAKVLMVTVELSGLHFNQNDSPDSLLGTYLFNDGAAACVICGDSMVAEPYLETISFHSALWPEGKEAMGWKVGDHGFELRLSSRVPVYLKSKVKEEVMGFGQEFDHYAIHPGGKNILKAFAQALELEDEKLQDSYEVLSKYGNMSSATILFVLNRMMESGDRKSGKVLAAAFGPGLTMESAVLKVKGV